MSTRGLFLIALMVAGLLLVAACGGDDPTAIPTTTQATPTRTSQPQQTPTVGASPTAGATGDAEAGEALFTSASPAPCSTCHETSSDRLVGPGLAGVGERAATRVQGLTADEYIRQSIREPTAFTVEGFPEGAMPAFTGLTDQQVNDLIAYLKTLE